MEILNERLSFKSFLDKLSKLVCSSHSLINCYYECLLEVHDYEKMRSMMIFNILWKFFYFLNISSKTELNYQTIKTNHFTGVEYHKDLCFNYHFIKVFVLPFLEWCLLICKEHSESDQKNLSFYPQFCKNTKNKLNLQKHQSYNELSQSIASK